MPFNSWEEDSKGLGYVGWGKPFGYRELFCLRVLSGSVVNNGRR